MHAAASLPKLTDAQVHAMAREYGFATSSDDEASHGGKNRASMRERRDSEKEVENMNNQNALMA